MDHMRAGLVARAQRRKRRRATTDLEWNSQTYEKRPLVADASHEITGDVAPDGTPFIRREW